MKLFEKAFTRKLNEDNIAGGGGVFGDTESMGHGGAVGNTDFYARGDNRIPKGSKNDEDDDKKDASKDVGVNMLMPVQRRPLKNSM